VARNPAFSVAGDANGELWALRVDCPETLRDWKKIDAVFCRRTPIVIAKNFGMNIYTSSVKYFNSLKLSYEGEQRSFKECDRGREGHHIT
jgi:hypothetical protein